MMRPDGQGTDEHDPHAAKRKHSQGAHSLERDVIRMAIAFAVVAVIGWVAVYLSNWAYEPPQNSASDPISQPLP